MIVAISMKTRDGSAYAEGLYTPEKTIVKAGGKISLSFNGCDAVRALRENRENVDEKGYIIRDCVFTSPSTAAQFVNGNISNGRRVWKVEGKTLGAYISEQR